MMRKPPRLCVGASGIVESRSCPQTFTATSHVSTQPACCQCDRKADHKGKHRQRFYGDDGKPFGAVIRWKRRAVRPTG